MCGYFSIDISHFQTVLGGLDMEENILSSVANKTDEHEYYGSFPKGYEVGKTKYVFVLGTVISGLGKGIFSSSLAMLFQNMGLKVEPIKLEGYLNIDSGTLNPFRHGEVFVLDDGTEADMDLGTYERFLDLNLDKDNFSTNGQLFMKILNMERKGSYLGRDVQFVPHVTSQVRMDLRKLAMKNRSEVVFVEIGGTVGDIENAHYIEAIREMIYEEGKENTCVVSLTYILKPSALGEQKSKAAQLGLRRLMAMGLVPDAIGCRCETPVDQKVMEKISISANVHVDSVFSMHNTKSIYNVPFMLKSSGIDKFVMDKLGLKGDPDKAGLAKWKGYMESINKKRKEIVVGITGKYTGLRDSYASIIMALEHSGVFHDADVKIKWIETTSFENGTKKVDEELSDVHGIIVPGGFGKRGTEGKIACVNYARKNKMPFLGLCLGFQMAVIDFARDVCKMDGANTTEVEPETKYPVIDILPEQEGITSLGGNMRLGIHDVDVKKDTVAFKLYGKELIKERFRHRYEVQPSMIKDLEAKGLVFSGKAPEQNIMQILELPTHPFFVASQFHPEFTSRPLRPNPMFKGFVGACIKYSE